MSSNTPLGRFVWADLMTNDSAAAVAFYTSTCGWGTDKWAGPVEGMPPYTMWTANGVTIGGTMLLPPNAPAPPHWLGYISTPDVQDTVNQAVGLGAKVMVPPTPIPTVGIFSVVADPQGAMFAAFSPESQTPGHEGQANMGEFSWFELATSAADEALAFYSALFGWTRMDTMDMGGGIMYQMFGRNGMPYGGMYKIGAEVSMPPNWCYYTRVDNIQAATERTRANGGKVLHGPVDVPGGDQIVMCLDPQGAMFAMHEIKARA